MSPRAAAFRLLVFLPLAPLAALSSGCTDATVEASEPSLDELRTFTERYRDVEVALAEGYVADPMNVCETADMIGKPASQGAMGVHYFRPDLLGITGPPNPRVSGTGTHADFHQPAVLIYEPQEDGSLELVAVENLVFREAWEAVGNTEPPSYHGVSFNLMEDDPETELDEAHMFEPHYDLHVWVHRQNPTGTFEQFNPDVTCRYRQRDAPPAE